MDGNYIGFQDFTRPRPGIWFSCSWSGLLVLSQGQHNLITDPPVSLTPSKPPIGCQRHGWVEWKPAASHSQNNKCLMDCDMKAKKTIESKIKGGKEASIQLHYSTLVQVHGVCISCITKLNQHRRSLDCKIKENSRIKIQPSRSLTWHFCHFWGQIPMRFHGVAQLCFLFQVVQVVQATCVDGETEVCEARLQWRVFWDS